MAQNINLYLEKQLCFFLLPYFLPSPEWPSFDFNFEFIWNNTENIWRVLTEKRPKTTKKIHIIHDSGQNLFVLKELFCSLLTFFKNQVRGYHVILSVVRKKSQIYKGSHRVELSEYPKERFSQFFLTKNELISRKKKCR